MSRSTRVSTLCIKYVIGLANRSNEQVSDSMQGRPRALGGFDPYFCQF